MEVGKVYTFKLNSGEELIAKVVENPGDGSITISEPVSIAPGREGMQMIPSMFTAEQGTNATLNTNNVSLFAITDDNIKDKYIEATTGIKLPDKKIILG
jgi:hypothetical protein